MHQDVTPEVLAGLAWYYLLASALNAAASGYVAYHEMVAEGASREGLAPRTRRFPEWLSLAVVGLYGAALVTVPFRWLLPGGLTVAYGLASLANGLLALTAGADAAHFAEVHGSSGTQADETAGGGPSLDDHVPAVGLGGPINRTLWSLVWSVVAVVFQAIGLTYFFKGPLILPRFVRAGVDYAAGPTTVFLGATLLFAAVVAFRRVFAGGLVAFGIVDLALLAFGLSLTDADFREIVAKPDNVPIVGLIVLVAGFTWFALRRAVINDARREADLPVLEALEPDKVLTWPDLVYTELICMVALTLFLIVWAVVLPAPLEQPAKATEAPNPSKAPWYFLGLQEMLVYFDPWLAGVAFPSLIILGLCAIPYIDANKEGSGYYTIAARPFAYVVFLFGFLVLWIVLIVLGTFLRGPNWNFFGPYERWEPHKVVPLNNVDLSDLVWVRALGRAKPSWALLREAPGLALLAFYLLALPPVLLRTVFQDYRARAGLTRSLTTVVLLLMMAALPLKMILRWTLNLKYVIAIPGFNI
ncbi:hypothetical protein [Paludisphaera mucosa]|uniref:Cytochrome b/b6 C-terminal region profile domain-containing protein n=1 Tax=Paludisphaera mucosa TaxID=3030827 RepID=A0ABT6FDA3_9BACT|nr:hypothetical protein [Paludisphaera mucosa]MDG3005573.1 hypothetical protein [Paludisphaera mucosa]